MKKALLFFIMGSCMITLLGCETISGITQDVANTARNIRDIFVAGKTIEDVVK